MGLVVGLFVGAGDGLDVGAGVGLSVGLDVGLYAIIWYFTLFVILYVSQTNEKQ